MQKIVTSRCERCSESLAFAARMPPEEAQVWRCAACGHRNYVPGGGDCDCPLPGPNQGCGCRCARFPQLSYQSDDWCNCRCHRVPA
jgi:hypothetical protein